MMLDTLLGGRASLPCHGKSYEWRRRKLAPACAGMAFSV